MKRIIDKTTGTFLRDDFTFNEETEIGLEVEPAQGFYQPRWDFVSEKWVEGLTVESIAAIPQQVSYEQKVIELIRQKYSIDEELAIQRQKDTKVDEFTAYFNYCEQCKIDAKN